MFSASRNARNFPQAFQLSAAPRKNGEGERFVQELFKAIECFCRWREMAVAKSKFVAFDQLGKKRVVGLADFRCRDQDRLTKGGGSRSKKIRQRLNEIVVHCSFDRVEKNAGVGRERFSHVGQLHFRSRSRHCELSRRREDILQSYLMKNRIGRRRCGVFPIGLRLGEDVIDQKLELRALVRVAIQR